MLSPGWEAARGGLCRPVSASGPCVRSCLLAVSVSVTAGLTGEHAPAEHAPHRADNFVSAEASGLTHHWARPGCWANPVGRRGAKA